MSEYSVLWVWAVPSINVSPSPCAGPDPPTGVRSLCLVRPRPGTVQVGTLRCQKSLASDVSLMDAVMNNTGFLTNIKQQYDYVFTDLRDPRYLTFWEKLKSSWFGCGREMSSADELSSLSGLFCWVQISRTKQIHWRWEYLSILVEDCFVVKFMARTLSQGTILS